MESETVDKKTENKDFDIPSKDSQENKSQSECSILTSEIIKDGAPSSPRNIKLNESESKDALSQESSSSNEENIISIGDESAAIFKQPNKKTAVSECSEKDDPPSPIDINITSDINELCHMIDTEVKSEIIEKIHEISSIVIQEKHNESSVSNIVEGNTSKTFKRPLLNQPLETVKRRRLNISRSKHGQTQSFGYGEKGDTCLCLSNLPCSWNDTEINKFIEDLEKECHTIKSHEILDDVLSNNKNRFVLLRFATSKKCRSALDLFKNKMADGGIIHVFRGKEELFREEHEKATSDDSKTKTDENEKQQVKMRKAKRKVTKRVDIWDDDPLGLYGLSEEFLREHDIRPPLTKWVHVRNFQVDKSQLKEIMELAGNVLLCHVVRTKTGYAKVRFSHPIEAAQAVSMLNGQMMHGRILSVCIDPGPHNNQLLPSGLAKIGPGFGPEGSPMRDIVKQYERHVEGKNNEINSEIFGKSTHKTMQISVNDTKIILAVVKELVDMGITTDCVIEHLKALKVDKTLDDKKSLAEKNNSTKSQLSQDVDNNAISSKDVIQSDITPMETTVTETKIQTTSSNNTTTLQTQSKPTNKTLPPKTSPNSRLQVAQNLTKNVTKSGPLSPPANSPNPTRTNNNAVNNKNAPNSNFGLSKNTFQRGSPIHEHANFRPGNSSPGFGSNIQNNSPFNATRPFGPNRVPGPFGFGSSSGPAISMNMGSSGPFGQHVSPNRPFRTPGPNPIGSSPWGNISPFGPNVMGPRPNFMGPGMGPGQNAMGSGPNVMGSGPNVIGPRPNVIGPGSNVMGPRPSAMGPGPNAMGPGPNAMGPGQGVIVSINNLPPSVTHGLLHDKMSECGKVQNISMTKTGYALIRYTNEWEAERCVNTYNNTVVDGKRIEVKRCLS